VATYPTVTGEKIVLRLFNGAPFQTLRELQLPESACDELEGFLRRNSGLLLLTGPAGSGKTTTITDVSVISPVWADAILSLSKIRLNKSFPE